jgi:4-hydroxybenzoate polyprenyltransferase
MPSDTFATPRPVPASRIPILGGSAVIIVALPIFALAGWRLDAWAIAAILWVIYLAIGLLLERLALGMDNLGSAGVVAVGRMFRAVALTGVLIAVAVSDSDLGLPAAIVYGLAFTVEFLLSLQAYFAGEARL